jgi:hypothetical protein
MNEVADPGFTILAGRFGSGKTEAALNYALLLAQGLKLETGGGKLRTRPSVSKLHAPVLIDLDIVTPYFRSRDLAKPMQDRQVEVIAPALVGQHLDTPAITPQILGAIQQRDRSVVLDVGGDHQGARVLGQYSTAIRQRGYTMHFVVNPYRPFTDTLPGLRRSISEIETSARLRVSSLVSNPNLIGETTAGVITEGHARIEAFAGGLDLPIAFVCIEHRWAGKFGTNHFAQPVLSLERHFVMSWE